MTHLLSNVSVLDSNIVMPFENESSTQLYGPNPCLFNQNTVGLFEASV